MFYPDVRGHISPSSLATWHSGKSAFVKSYFEGEKSPETLAMKTGKQIHALIEGGLLTPLKVFENKETKLEVSVSYSADPLNPLTVLGIPDSHEQNTSKRVHFVDYKTGKENTWNPVKLATDLKMKCTAWLVWKRNPKAKIVTGHLNYIQTEWNEETREIVPTGKQEEITIDYTAKELEGFTKVILKTIKDINKEYEKWVESSSKFVGEEDVKEYVALYRKIEMLGEELTEVGARITSQMELGNVGRHKSDMGTFYFVERKKYDYPTKIEVKVGNLTYKLKEAEEKKTEFDAAIKGVKKDFEKSHEPHTITKSLSYRSPKENGKIK